MPRTVPAKTLAEWRAVADAATAGPWKADVNRFGVPEVWSSDWEHLCTAEQRQDAAFIAAAREMVPRLLDEVERLRAVQKAALDLLVDRGWHRHPPDYHAARLREALNNCGVVDV